MEVTSQFATGLFLNSDYLVSLLTQTAIETGVLDGNGRLGSQRAQQLEIVLGEAFPGHLIEDL